MSSVALEEWARPRLPWALGPGFHRGAGHHRALPHSDGRTHGSTFFDDEVLA
ncbi:MAG: hypothetical protein IT380_00475 [Myxococcales bacterium]|nr:hypothetical protein [Myxococcales bacterium]